MAGQDTSTKMLKIAEELKRIAEDMDPEEDEEELEIPDAAYRIVYKMPPPDDPIPGATFRTQCEIVIPTGGPTSTSKGEVRRLTKGLSITAEVLSEILK